MTVNRAMMGHWSFAVLSLSIVFMSGFADEVLAPNVYTTNGPFVRWTALILNASFFYLTYYN